MALTLKKQKISEPEAKKESTDTDNSNDNPSSLPSLEKLTSIKKRARSTSPNKDAQQCSVYVGPSSAKK